MGSATVECHSGYTFGERPIAVHWHGQRLIIQEIEARRRVPGGTWFRVRTEDGQVFELLYDAPSDQWGIDQP